MLKKIFPTFFPPPLFTKIQNKEKMLLEIVGKILSIENEIIIVASVMAAKDVLDYCVVAGVPARIIKKKY